MKPSLTTSVQPETKAAALGRTAMIRIILLPSLVVSDQLAKAFSTSVQPHLGRSFRNLELFRYLPMRKAIEIFQNDYRGQTAGQLSKSSLKIDFCRAHDRDSVTL